MKKFLARSIKHKSQNERLLKEAKNLKQAIEDLKLGLQKENPTVEQTERKNSKPDTLTGKTSRPYSILLSSCQKQESVQKVLSEYKLTDLEPYVVKVDLGENGIWWRIFAGHYETREKAIRGINRLGLTDKIVLKESSANQTDTSESQNEEVNTQ